MTKIMVKRQGDSASAEDAFAKLLRLIRVRERSVSEMRQRLLDADFESEAVETAIKRAQSCGLLDDVRFADEYIQRKLYAGWGCKRIEQGLLTFSISREIIDDHSEELFNESFELERAVRELKQFKTNAKNLNEARYRRLMSKGYSYGVVTTAVMRIEGSEQD